MKSDRYSVALWLILALWVLWLAGVLLHGFAVDLWPGTNPDFSRSGAFGDSFGSLASLMAALAAAGALLTLRQQSKDSAKQNFDSNFFGLLDHFQSVTLSVDAHNFVAEEQEDGSEITRLNYIFQGHDAFRAILDELQLTIEAQDFGSKATMCSKYGAFYEVWQDDLGHYFRLLYHLFKTIEEKCPADPYFYARLVRAHLSSPELILLAYNCTCGEGREKFVRYLSEFHILHNMGRKSDPLSVAERDFFERELPREAFQSLSEKLANAALTSTERGG